MHASHRTRYIRCCLLRRPPQTSRATQAAIMASLLTRCRASSSFVCLVLLTIVDHCVSECCACPGRPGTDACSPRADPC